MMTDSCQLALQHMLDSGRAFPCRSCLKYLLGPFQLFLSLRRQVLAGPVNEDLDHPNPRADAFGADLLAGHGLGDGPRALGEKPRGWVRGNGFDVVRPEFPFRLLL